MGLRLFGRRRRSAAPVGRHARALPVVTVPGAAARLVASVVRDPLVTGDVGVGLVPPAPIDVASAPQPAVTPALTLEAAPAVTAAVGLVFADGASVQLAEDDPRVRTFRATAAALLEHTSS